MLVKGVDYDYKILTLIVDTHEIVDMELTAGLD